jgi:enediyne biosynthesis protein E4
MNKSFRIFLPLLLSVLIAGSLNLAGQTPPKKPEPQQPMGGVSTGAPINYTSKKTVGITDPKAPVVFEDVTDKTALANFKHRAGTPAKDYIFEVPSGGVAIFDYDGDGLPDIYLLNGSTVPALQGKEKPPRAALYHNLGNWKFEDVTDKAGVANERWGMGVAVGDYDNDGRPDIFVSNFGVSRLYHNNGDGTFTDVGLPAGVALSEEGREQAGMGVDFADYDHDGQVDLIKTNFSDDANNLYHSNGDGTFNDVTFLAGLGEVSWLSLGFGVKFLDFDNDGWKDIFVANGHVNPEVDSTSTGITYAERNFLFRNLRNGRFEEIGRQAGPGLATRKVSRGLAVADYDNDGQEEILVTNLDSSPDFLRNLRHSGHHSVALKTIGRESNRDGYGARLTVRAGDLIQYDQVRSCGSYLSASDSRCHFGLGAATIVDQLEIRWPSGRLEILKGLRSDHVLVIEEGKGLVDAIPFRKLAAKGRSTQEKAIQR